jgi:plastocyanin
MVPGHRFDPETITVSVGDAVTWRVRTDEPHSVTAYEESLPEGAEYFASGGFSSEEDARANVADGLLREGDSFEVTFQTAGTYEYFCIPHESDGMTGTVVVEE